MSSLTFWYNSTGRVSAFFTFLRHEKYFPVKNIFYHSIITNEITNALNNLCINKYKFRQDKNNENERMLFMGKFSTRHFNSKLYYSGAGGIFILSL